MRYLEILFFLIFTFYVHRSEGYRILCLFPYNGRSHQRMFESLCKGLAMKGHQIDMISHFPMKSKIANYTDIVDLSGTRKTIVNSVSVESAKKIHGSLLYYMTSEFGYSLCELMGSERMQNFIKNPPNDPPYDLILTEFFGSPCYLGFGHYLKTPIAIVVSFLEMINVDDFMGSPLSFAYYPRGFNERPVLTTFFDRLWNFVTSFKEMQEFYYYTSKHNDITRKYLGQDVPDVRELEKSVSLALVNGHYSISGIRPQIPSIVDIAGLHVESDDSMMTTTLKTWMDSAKHGIVYFTLGSLVNIETLPKKALLSLYASFAKISPVKVLMKSANATMLPPGLPSNVITLPWIPQVSVLKHKNTRVFITHGGLMGSQEAIYFGIPMIGIPIFADQTKNIKIMVHKNMAFLMSLDDINERTMSTALNALLYDPKYKKAAITASKLFRDRPMTPIDTSAYWIEYIIRNGPNSLRAPPMDMPWWQIELLDIGAFLLIFATISVYLLIVSLRFLLKKYHSNIVQPEKKLN